MTPEGEPIDYVVDVTGETTRTEDDKLKTLFKVVAEFDDLKDDKNKRLAFSTVAMWEMLSAEWHGTRTNPLNEGDAKPDPTDLDWSKNYEKAKDRVEEKEETFEKNPEYVKPGEKPAPLPAKKKVAPKPDSPEKKYKA
ncbi:unnamed protein product [Amoebophrya sp. A120]|nr:unnamed protein product [Amoebophrya sp. A120]|eukprot:GSA120T00023406001.1